MRNSPRHPATITVLSATAALALSGCAAISPPPQGTLFEREGVSMVVIPGGSRETYFSDAKSLERHCRAPSPDVSVTASEGVSFSMPSLTGKGIGLNEDASSGSLSLGGRNPAVLITRELLYRSCELSNNLNLPSDQALSLFRDTMEAIVRISAGQTGRGTTPVSASPMDTRIQTPSPASGASGRTSVTAPSGLPSVIPGGAPSTGARPPGW